MWLAFVDSPWSTLAYPFTLLAAVLLGVAYARRRYHGHQRRWQTVGIEGGIFSMYGLLLSFTLVASGNAVRTRDAAVHTEAADVLALSQQSLLAPPALRAATARHLRRYLALQLQHPTPTPEQCRRQIGELSAASHAFTQRLAAYAARHPAETAAVQSLQNQAGALHATALALLYSFRERTPSLIVVALVCLSWAMGLLVGFMNSFQPQPSRVLPALFVGTAALLMTTIRDLDDPSRGIVTPDYEDLFRTQQLLGTYAPAPSPASPVDSLRQVPD
ncbi:hypothetical protein Q5H92_20715 [Hymenobacter sp. M29]|uniref:DUF4239 domain-containing protein n=1 Tax=Hymenobacter mellowenesis TaxID=3063995 RepID=A0ABT9AG07_9BACT|nr:hypothetical protein [Hymenobacter sp. M29]MDO7848800.1 hypothetical protein [Hymenobacter sp. M29]